MKPTRVSLGSLYMSNLVHTDWLGVLSNGCRTVNEQAEQEARLENEPGRFPWWNEPW